MSGDRTDRKLAEQAVKIPGAHLTFISVHILDSTRRWLRSRSFRGNLGARPRLLCLAVAGCADCLVSKDRALLELNRRGGLGFAIVTPAEACHRLGLIGVTD